MLFKFLQLVGIPDFDVFVNTNVVNLTNVVNPLNLGVFYSYWAST